MEEYLAFVDYIGRTIDGKYIYRFDFTVDTDSVWGEYFNVTPAGIVPDLQPDINSLSKSCKVNLPIEMQLAKKNYCFSMQDCIDGIIPLIFSEISEEGIEYNDAPLFFKFGENFETIKETLQSINIELYDIEDVKKGDESAIDDLIDNIDLINGDNEYI
jgi:hypothetical protein